MKKLTLLALFAACAYGQKFNGKATGIMDASGLTFIFPTATFATPPSSPPVGAVYVFTDSNSPGVCTGGGASKTTCRWNGSGWDSIGGGGGGGGSPTGAAGGSLAGTYPNPTLTAINSAIGACGDSTHVSQITLNSEGRASNCTSVLITGSGGGGGSGGGVPFVSTLQTGPDKTFTVTGAAHGFTTIGLDVLAYDSASPRNAIQVSWTVDPASYNVVGTFGTPQSSYYIVIMSGAGGNSLPPFTCPVTATSSVTCTHNLNTNTPAVWCYDSAGLLMGSTGSAAQVTVIDSHLVNATTITFSGSVTGTCILNSGAAGGGGGFSQANSLGSGGGTGYQTNNDCNKGSLTLSGGAFAWNGNSTPALAATFQEFTIVTALNGNQRYDHAMVSEHTVFTSGTVTGLTVSMGRPTGATDDELVAQTALMKSSSDVWFAYERPQPPLLGSSNTYTVVLALRTVGGNVSDLTAGQVNYEVCGYAAH